MRKFLKRLGLSLSFYLVALIAGGKLYAQNIEMFATESTVQVQSTNFPFFYEVTLSLSVPNGGSPIFVGSMRYQMSVNANNFVEASLDQNSFTVFGSAASGGTYDDPTLTTTTTTSGNIATFEVNVTFNSGSGGFGYQLQGGTSVDVCKVRLGLGPGLCGRRSGLVFNTGPGASFVRSATAQLPITTYTPIQQSRFIVRPPSPANPQPVFTVIPAKIAYCSTELINLNIQNFAGLSQVALGKLSPGGSIATRTSLSFTTPAINVIVGDQSLNLSNGDSILAVYRNVAIGGTCDFETNKIALNIDDPLTFQDPPTVLGGSNPDDGIRICAPGQIPQGYDYTVIPGIPQGSPLTYNWTIDPPAAAGIITPVLPDSSIVKISYSPTFSGYASLNVRTTNACPGNPINRLKLTFSQNIPGAVSLPAPRSGRNLNDTICISDTALQFFKVPANPSSDYAHTYQWGVYPDSAWSAPPTVSVEDSTQVLLNWNRKYPNNFAFVRVRAVNGCGAGPWDSVKVNLRPLPPKQGRAFNIDNPLVDTICQTRIADSTRFTFEVKRPDLITGGKKKYYWWVLRAPEKNGTIYQPAGNPDPTRWQQGVDSTDTDTNYIPWNPRYYGWVKIVVAARSRFCNFGNTAYNLPKIPRDTSGLGDTVTKYFFIRPLPLLPSPPIGERAISTNDTGDTIRLSTRLGARFATGYGWLITDTGKIREPVNLGTFLHVGNNPNYSDSLFTFLKLADTLTPGEYYVRTYGVNQCGFGDSSRVLILKVSQQRPQAPADTLSSFTVLGCNTPYYRVNSPNPEIRWSLCQNPPNIVYKTSHPDAAYFKWKLTPDTAGAIVVGPNPLRLPRGLRIPSPPCPGNPAPDLGLDSNVIVVDFNDNFVGTCTLTVYPINGENNDDTLSWEQHKAERIIRVFESPRAFAGISGTTITGAKYMMGGGSVISPNVPRTAVGGSLPYRKFDWTPANLFPNVAAVDSNPIIRPLAEGSYNISLSITDSNQCTSAPSTAQIVVNLGYAFNTKVFLEGPFDTTTGRMHTKLYDSTTNPYGEPGGYFARWIKRTVQDIGDTFMSAGYRSIPVGPNGEKPVDAVTFELRSDSLLYPNSGQIPLVASGRAWLMEDGTIRDFETGTEPLVRLSTLNTPVSGLRPRTDGVFLVLNHKNHLPVLGTRLMFAPFSFNNPGTQPGDTAFVDLTDSTNFAFTRRYGGGVKKLNTPSGPVWVAVAGDIYREPSPDGEPQKEVNANDMNYFRVYQAFNFANFPLNNAYMQEDLNLDGRVDYEDYDLINKNSIYLYNSLVP